MRKLLILFILLPAFLFLLGNSAVTHAASASIPGIGTVDDISEGGPAGLAVGFYRLGFLVTGLISFGILLYAAALAGTAGGNPSKLTLAKDWALAALSGLVLLVFAFLLLRTVNPAIVENLGVPELTPLESPPGDGGGASGGW